MYEHMTFDDILGRALARVLTANPNLDTREGSIIYDALAPAAAEMAMLYVQLDTILTETFADTASRPYLVLRAAERGITPTPASSAILQGVFNIDVPIGARFSYELLNFMATKRLLNGTFEMTCEQPGVIGNAGIGALVPIDYIPGLTDAQTIQIITPGEEAEDVDHLRRRYFDSFKGLAFGGNIADYKQKVEAFPGVGGARVTPVWNGGGTVLVTIIGSDWVAPSQPFVDYINNALDPLPGQGEGVAPIGHVVTVLGVVPVVITIAVSVTYQTGYSWDDVADAATDVIDAYFEQLAKTWADMSPLVVRISQIESRLLDVPGVVDIQNATINGSGFNLVLSDEIPVLGLIHD